MKILNEKELNLFLRILAEESVKMAYEQEEKTASSLFEQEEDEEEDPLFGGSDDKEGDEGGDEAGGDELDLDLGGDDEGGEANADEEPALDEPEPEKEEKVNVRPVPLTLELGEVTSDGLIATLNMIRAGRSFKEPDVSANLEKYFEEQLSDSERLALATFLSALRDLTSGTPAEEAPDPGDENINIDATGKERREEEPEARGPSRPALRPTVQRTSRGVENTAPPIQVGPRNAQLAEEYRKHVRSILIK